MSADVAAVLEAAGSLPAAPRRELVEPLAAGLDDEIVTPLSGAWRREIAARLADYDAGRVDALTREQVEASARRARWRPTGRGATKPARSGVAK